MLSIYTDGSCSLNNVNDKSKEGTGGWSFVLVNEDGDISTQQGIEFDTTNNRMELTAVLFAMRYAAEKHPQEEYTIYTDSAYIANCFAQKWYKKWQVNGYKTSNRQAVKNTDLWKMILALYHGHEDKIHFAKVAGHADNDYNILADHLANLWRKQVHENISINTESSGTNS